MATIIEKKDKNGKVISYKAVIRHNKKFVACKTFSIKGNRKQTTKNEAIAWGLEIDKKIDEGVYRHEEKKANYTVVQAIEKYINDGNPKKSEKTRNEFISCLNWFKKQIGSIPIRMLERSDLKACRNKLKQKHKIVPIKGKAGKETNEFISNASVNKYLAQFSIFLSHCVNEYEIIKSNPMIGAKLKLKENEPRKSKGFKGTSNTFTCL